MRAGARVRGAVEPSPARGQGLSTTSSFPRCGSAGVAAERCALPGCWHWVTVGTRLGATRAPALAATSGSGERGLSSSAGLGRRRGCGAEVLQGTSLCLLKGIFVKRSLQLACDPFPLLPPSLCPSLTPALPPCLDQPGPKLARALSQPRSRSLLARDAFVAARPCPRQRDVPSPWVRGLGHCITHRAPTQATGLGCSRRHSGCGARWHGALRSPSRAAAPSHALLALPLLKPLYSLQTPPTPQR